MRLPLFLAGLLLSLVACTVEPENGNPPATGDDAGKTKTTETPAPECDGSRLAANCRSSGWKVARYGFGPSCKGTPWLPDGDGGVVFRDEPGREWCIELRSGNPEYAPTICCR